MKISIWLILIISFANSRILQKKEVAHTFKLSPAKNSANSKVRPPRKLYYVVESAKKPVVALQNNKNKRKLQEQKRPIPVPSLHLNKSFVVPRGHLEKLRSLAQKAKQSHFLAAKNGQNRRLNADHAEAHDGTHENHDGGHENHDGGHGHLEELEHEEGHHKLQSTPLLLIGDYEIIVEKRDDI